MKKTKSVNEIIADLESEISVAKTQGNTKRVKVLSFILEFWKRRKLKVK